MWWKDEQLRALQTVFKKYKEYFFLLLYDFVWDMPIDFENTARAFVKWCKSIQRQRVFDNKCF